MSCCTHLLLVFLHCDAGHVWRRTRAELRRQSARDRCRAAWICALVAAATDHETSRQKACYPAAVAAEAAHLEDVEGAPHVSRAQGDQSLHASLAQIDPACQPRHHRSGHGRACTRATQEGPQENVTGGMPMGTNQGETEVVRLP